MHKHLLVLTILCVFISVAAATPLQVEDIIWTSIVGVSVNGNILTKTAGTGWGNAGAFSVQYIAAGNDGYAEITVKETSTYRMFGLSDTDASLSYDTIDYAIYTSTGGELLVYENGVRRELGLGYTTNDVLQVAREGSYIKYSKNGQVFRTVSALSGNLYADASFYNTGSTVYNAKIATTVPEPTSWLLLSAGLLLVRRKMILVE
ncbi:MAG: PEP-CTERM sorting domain-containing protein [Candidatus Brocadiae bacterium]|nr:PEP-CTERM sorting domain-containing protein [Candidatus Brocadiia bacterium]